MFIMPMAAPGSYRIAKAGPYRVGQDVDALEQLSDGSVRMTLAGARRIYLPGVIAWVDEAQGDLNPDNSVAGKVDVDKLQKDDVIDTATAAELSTKPKKPARQRRKPKV
ncbi:MAG TPA: hypothetical protein ENK57_03860 [Polyangiaceae bacterium]|nr:hypothetical protein [Polyangiaceae bacterium]